MRFPTSTVAKHGPGRRPAFTLLEVLLATAIGVLLMGALYVAVNVQLRHAQEGRETVEQGTLVRGVLNRIDNDIRASLASVKRPTTSAAGGQSSGASPSGGSSSTGASASGAGAAGAGTSGSGTGTSGSGTSGSASSTSTGTVTGMVFNLGGVQGDTNQLVLYVSRVPREISPAAWTGSDTSLPPVSDLRRITYWLAPANGSPGGLACQEVKLVTSGDALSVVPPDVPDEARVIVAEEVRSLEFSYFDGTDWQNSWDGASPGQDGVTPIGPPAAVAVKIGIAAPGSAPGSGQNLKYYRHVVAIPTANGFLQQNTTGSSQTTGMSSSP